MSYYWDTSGLRLTAWPTNYGPMAVPGLRVVIQPLLIGIAEPALPGLLFDKLPLNSSLDIFLEFFMT